MSTSLSPRISMRWTIAMATLHLATATGVARAENFQFRVFSPFKANASFTADFDIPFSTTRYAARSGSLDLKLISNTGVAAVTDYRYQPLPGTNPPIGDLRLKSSAWGAGATLTLEPDPASLSSEVNPTNVRAITNDGRFISGSAILQNAQFAARWDASTGAITTLKSLDNAALLSSFAHDIDPSGTVIGSVNLTGVGDRPVVWPVDGEARILPSPANVRSAKVFSRNQSAVSVGGYTPQDRLNQTLPVRWISDQSPTPLLVPTTMLGASNFFATTSSSISDSGFIASNTLYARPSDNAFRSSAIRWTPGSISGEELIGLAVTDQTSVGGLLEDGTIIGGVFTSTFQSLVVRWAPNSVTPTLMGTLGGNSYVSGINSLGYAVGTSNDLAVLWNPNGTIIDLNTLFPLPTGVVLQDAYSISDNGWIVGHTRPTVLGSDNFRINSPIFAFQLPTLIPEPSVFAIIIAPFACLSRCRRSHRSST